MTCAEFLEQTEAYAISALEPDQLAAAEAHLAEPNQGCKEALDRARSGWAALALSVEPVKPPARLWTAIEASISAAPVAAGPLRVRSRERSFWALGLAACFAMLALAAYEIAARTAREHRLETTYAQKVELLRRELLAEREALAILQSPSSVLVPLAPQAGAKERAAAILDLSRHAALVMASALELQKGRDYELWIIRGDAKLPAGLLRAGPDGTALLHLEEKLLAQGGPDALAITLEPAGGSAQPTGAILLLAKVPKA